MTLCRDLLSQPLLTHGQSCFEVHTLNTSRGAGMVQLKDSLDGRIFFSSLEIMLPLET